jgi:long-chain acyl-CoA synthetase
VFGIPDEQWGHRVCAAVAGTVSEQQVRQYANEHLAPYKRPKTILVVTDLPISHSGKVDRSRLLALLRGE